MQILEGVTKYFAYGFGNQSELFYLAKIGEINLKKGNLKDFEMRLLQNTKTTAKNKSRFWNSNTPVLFPTATWMS